MMQESNQSQIYSPKRVSKAFYLQVLELLQQFIYIYIYISKQKTQISGLTSGL